MLTLLLEHRLYLAPLDTLKLYRILDVGCGTGIWAIDFADAHPATEVIGIDLSPIQPSWTPPNCHFAIDDVEEEWTYPSDHFDFIHIRCLMGSISSWPKLYGQAFDHLAPGGWIQHLDMIIEFKSDDASVGEGHIMPEWSQTFVEAGEKLGKTFRLGEAGKWIREAGFEEVRETWFKVPVGTWTKDKVSVLEKAHHLPYITHHMSVKSLNRMSPT